MGNVLAKQITGYPPDDQLLLAQLARAKREPGDICNASPLPSNTRLLVAVIITRCTHMCNAYVDTYIHTHMHACRHAGILCACMYVFVLHTYVHVYVYIYIHTYIYIIYVCRHVYMFDRQHIVAFSNQLAAANF